MVSSAGSSLASECSCIGGHIGVVGGPCYNAQACEVGFNKACPWLSVCHNTVVGPLCSAFVPSGKIRLIKGARQTSTNSYVLLNTTKGGSVLSFTVHLGNMTAVSQVLYGRDQDPEQFNCSAVSVKPFAAAQPKLLNVTCTVSACAQIDL